MNPDNSPTPRIPHEIAKLWNLTLITYLDSAQNDNWLVESRGIRFVLRRYKVNPSDDLPYELEVMHRVQALGWPIPEVVEQPFVLGGRTWCLFTWLPGAPPINANTPDERRARGRLLAELHESTAELVHMGQRRGFSLSDEVVRDPGLIPALEEYEKLYPDEGHVLRWHLDRTLELFDGIDLDSAETIVLHSDFAPWNLLFVDGNLTGILDFEATHLNYRVADFANSWRGYQDELIEGYEEIHKLSDLDWELLTPVYWAWMFFGVKSEIEAMLSEKKPPHDFEWQTRHLLRRDGLLGQRAQEYPGRTTRR